MAEVGLQFGFCLVLGLGLGLQGGFRFCLGFPLDASGVLRHSFLLGVIGGQLLGRFGGLPEQLVKSGRPAARLQVGGGAALRFLLRMGRGRKWPRVACGNSGLVLAIEGAVCRGEVGFELSPPSGQGRRFASWLRLLLFGQVPGESVTFQRPWP